jgi:tetratricopeptide (TPR) repeat protein
MSTLVGRSKEIAAIKQSLANLVSGQGGTLFFAGEPGIGKSALARWLSDEARSQSLPVFWGFCWEAGGAPAYWPWTQSLRSLVAAQDIPDALLARLAQLLPEVAGDDPKPELQPEQARFLLLESARLLLEHASRDKPLILIYEDLHAADADSLNLLQYLARHANTMPVLLVGTYREFEARQSESADALWRAGRDAQVLRLTPLDEVAVIEYLKAAGNESPATGRARELLETTAGNPLFLTELVSLMGESRGGELPETIQQVISQQIDLLPDATAAALAQASVLGREFGVAALANLREQSEEETKLDIEPAAAAGMINPSGPRRYRFTHVLHRNVLYQGLGAGAREGLHSQCAAYIRSLIDAGDEDRWSVYATHLQAAGSGHRNDAIAAWEKSAVRAHARLAFDDAARSMQNALAAFGEGPKFDPTARCELQIHCALAMQLAGDIEGGQAHCREAFAKGRTLEDPALMSEAALTYGNAFVVGMVDKELVGMLRECLDALPPDDAKTRARVLARLAGAMQPAVDPVPPMEMARDAITLARTTDDEATMFAVLRSALSALMDFASPTERIPLNREFEALAAKRGNAAGQFRSHLRLMFDGAEIGDRQMLDDAVDAAEHIANRIGLPHYQWRVASARAMQHMIEGRFGRASALLDQAQQLAERANDLEARITLPLQRFSVLCEWNSTETTPLAEIQAQLEDAYASGMGAAEFFAQPFVTACSDNVATESAKLLGNDALMERTFSGGDRSSLSVVGEMAVAAGNTELAERTYEALGLYSNECSTLGLMGGCWQGPVGYTLGNIAHSLGRPNDAQQHFETALAIATRMRAQPMVARIRTALGELAEADGDANAAAEHRRIASDIIKALDLRETARAPTAQISSPAPATTPATRFSMELDGDIQIVRYDEESTSLKNNKGLQILARLIGTPDRDIHVLDLVGSADAPAATESGDAGPLLDDQARADYQRRVTELREGLEEAESLGDLGQADALREELDFITRELSRAYGIGGRERRAGNTAERARVNVRRRLKDAIERIGQQMPNAARYLENTIKTGSYCRYSPM